MSKVSYENIMQNKTIIFIVRSNRFPTVFLNGFIVYKSLTIAPEGSYYTKANR